MNSDPPYNVKVEPRSNNAIAAGLSSFSATHHQGLDVARHPSKKPAPRTSKLRAKDRPLANDFVSDDEFDRLLRAWFGNARPRPASRVARSTSGVGSANLRQLPDPRSKKPWAVLQRRAIVWDKQHPVLTRKDFMTRARAVLLRVEARAPRTSGTDPHNVPDLCGR